MINKPSIFAKITLGLAAVTALATAQSAMAIVYAPAPVLAPVQAPANVISAGFNSYEPASLPNYNLNPVPVNLAVTPVVNVTLDPTSPVSHNIQGNTNQVTLAVFDVTASKDITLTEVSIKLDGSDVAQNLRLYDGSTMINLGNVVASSNVTFYGLNTFVVSGTTKHFIIKADIGQVNASQSGRVVKAAVVYVKYTLLSSGLQTVYFPFMVVGNPMYVVPGSF